MPGLTRGKDGCSFSSSNKNVRVLRDPAVRRTESCSRITASIAWKRVSNTAAPPNAGNETALLTVETTNLSVCNRITFEKLHAHPFRGQDTQEVKGGL
jgi:hypothetical protein